MHHWQMKIKGTLKWYLHLMSYLKTLKSWVTQQRNQKLLIDNYFCEPLISKNKWWWGFFLARELRKMKGTKLVSHKTASDSVPVLWEACKRWGACEGRWEGGESPLSHLPPPSDPFTSVVTDLDCIWKISNHRRGIRDCIETDDTNSTNWMLNIVNSRMIGSDCLVTTLIQ